MEERVPPATTNSEDSSEDPQKLLALQSSHKRATPPQLSFDDDLHQQTDDHNPNNQLSLAVRSTGDLDTYVIHFPKDQVYRVPPPENAAIVERFRKPSLKKKRTCTPRLICCLVTFLVIALLIAGIVISYKLLFNPKAADISINNIHVRKNDTKSKSSLPAGYHVVLKVHNPNSRMGMKYGNGDGVALMFADENLGSGEFPKLSQETDKSSEINLDLQGSKNTLPKEVDKSINDHKSGDHSIWLKLKFSKIPVDYKVWDMTFASKKMDVTCDFRVSSLRGSTKILTQNCDAHIS